jgi:hypothetical protein
MVALQSFLQTALAAVDRGRGQIEFLPVAPPLI